MADIISNFPDSILCYILSFLPTKQVVATSILSMHWNLLWRSVPSLDFDVDTMSIDYDKEKEGISRLLLSVNSFLGGRDMDQILHRFRLRCPCLYNQNSIETCIEDVLRKSARLQHLDLDLGFVTGVPSVVFICKTLVVLKLAFVSPKNVSFVDLPLLKILHLNSVSFLDCEYLLQQFLSGSPNIEELEVETFNNFIIKEFHSLPKLVRAKIDAPPVFPLKIIKNVEVFVTNRIYNQDLVFDFQNLVQLEFVTWEDSEGWLDVLKVFRHCPKLQTLFIRIKDDEEDPVLPYPLTVPTCISLHLKTCCLQYYRGSEFEFQFAEYIMLNANYLRTMKFLIRSDDYNNLLRRHDMIRDLSSCSKSSDACTLSFEKY